MGNILALNDDSVGNEESSFKPSELITLLEDTNDYLSFREQQVIMMCSRYLRYTTLINRIRMKC